MGIIVRYITENGVIVDINFQLITPSLVDFRSFVNTFSIGNFLEPEVQRRESILLAGGFVSSFIKDKI